MHFIIEKLAIRLQLKTKWTVNLALSGFLQSREQDIHKVVKSTVPFRDKTEEDRDCGLRKYTKQSSVSHPTRAMDVLDRKSVLLLKNTCHDKVGDNELTVGSDFYWKFITVNQINSLNSSSGCLIYRKFPTDDTECRTELNWISDRPTLLCQPDVPR